MFTFAHQYHQLFSASTNFTLIWLCLVVLRAYFEVNPNWEMKQTPSASHFPFNLPCEFASYFLYSEWEDRKDTWGKELTTVHWDGETHVSSYSGSCTTGLPSTCDYLSLWRSRSEGPRTLKNINI